MRNHLKTKFLDRPGWNDYLMVLWFMTGNPAHACEIYRRAVAIPNPAGSPMAYMTAATARWMVSSVRSQHPDFDRAISALESQYGLVVSSLVPPPIDPNMLSAEFPAVVLPADPRADPDGSPRQI